MRNTLAYKEALAQGNNILSHISEPKKSAQFAKFVYELGWIYYDMGDARQAIEYYGQALSIDKAVYGDRHPTVAIRLNNIGSAWTALDDSPRAKEYFLQAYDIFREFYGDEHPSTRTVKGCLNQLGA